MSIHDGEVAAGPDVVRRLLARHRPDLADARIEHIGEGTDNTMFRVGADLLLRLPRTEDTSATLRKELRWLPALGPRLGRRVPEPVLTGEPSADFPLAWAVYRWIDGEAASTAGDVDWASYGEDLAAFVADLHAVDLLGQERAGELAWYRGGRLEPHDEWVPSCLAEIRALTDDVDVDRLQVVWDEALRLPAPAASHVWLHGDLKPSNVLVRSGRLHAVIDFGGLSIGYPDAEHAPVWDLPAEARHAYRAALDVDDLTWRRARAWALLVAASGVPYYWSTYPAFAAECVRRLQAVAADD